MIGILAKIVVQNLSLAPGLKRLIIMVKPIKVNFSFAMQIKKDLYWRL